MESDWGESTITWDNGSNNYVPPILASVDKAAYVPADVWYTFDVTSTVQEFVTNSSSNHGFMIIAEGIGGYENGGFFFRSSEYGDVGFRPKLTIEHSGN